MSPEGVVPDLNEAFWWIFPGEPRVEDGHVRLAGQPGLGLELNPQVVERYRSSRLRAPADQISTNLYADFTLLLEETRDHGA